MEQSKSWLDKVSFIVQYSQAVVAAISTLLLLIGIVTASANFLTKDAIFGGRDWLQVAWAFDQSIAVDANLALVAVAFFDAVEHKKWVAMAAYFIIGALLFSVAAAIMDIESIRQALNISLGQASTYILVPLSVLTQLRSVVVVCLIVVSSQTPKLIKLKSNSTSSNPSSVNAPVPIEKVKTKRKETTPMKSQKDIGYTRYVDILTRSTYPLTLDQMAKTLGKSKSMVSKYSQRYKNEHNKTTTKINNEVTTGSTGGTNQSGV